MQFHILVVICDFCYNLYNTMRQRKWYSVEAYIGWTSWVGILCPVFCVLLKPKNLVNLKKFSKKNFFQPRAGIKDTQRCMPVYCDYSYYEAVLQCYSRN